MSVIWKIITGIPSAVKAGFDWARDKLRRQEREFDRQAGANEQKARTMAEEQKAQEAGREAAEEITTGDDADAAIKRMRERRKRSD